MALSAPVVSAKLKEAGFGIEATRNREGIRVSRGALAGRVCVSVDLDRPGEARRTAVLLEQWLVSNADALGWSWAKHSGDSGIYTLTHRPLTPPEDTARRGKDTEALALAHTVRQAVARLHTAIYEDHTPAQADITAARTALEALIALAGGAQ